MATPATTHVFPKDNGWAVKREGSAKSIGLYSTQRDAVEAARAISRRMRAGQVVVHLKSGGFQVKYRHGLPALQRVPVKSSLDAKAVERAVSATIRKHLAAGG